MSAEELTFAGAVRQAEAIRAGEVSPKELVEMCLARIEKLDPQLNAFRVVLAERALAEAEEAGKRIAAGEEGSLLGVPIALKDSLDLEGEVTTHGTGAFDEPAKADDEMTSRLRAAGAIVVGKTNLPELAIVGFTESKTWGVTRNPWNTDKTPGGSSGGSASAVAAGLVPIASASDGGGSIRIPAANCGLFGIKPQRGRISLAPATEHWRGLSVNGCVSRTVADSALWLDVTSGGSSEPGAPAQPETSFAEEAKAPPGKLRIAFTHTAPRALLPPTVDENVHRAVTDMAQVLRGLGHEVSEQDPKWGMVGNNMTPRYLGGVSDDVKAVPHPERLESRTKGFGKLGARFPDGMARKAREAEEADRARIGAIFDRYDVLLTPVMGGTSLPAQPWPGRGALRTILPMSRFYPYCIV